MFQQLETINEMSCQQELWDQETTVKPDYANYSSSSLYFI